MRTKVTIQKQRKIYRHKLYNQYCSSTYEDGSDQCDSNTVDTDIYQEADPVRSLLCCCLTCRRMNRNASGGGSACDLPSGVSASTIKTETNVYISGVAAYERRWCQNGSSSSATKYYDRITKLKDGIIDLLYGNSK